MSNYKLDLFGEVLPAIDRRDMEFYDRLTDDQKKGFAPPVALRAASGLQYDGPLSEHYIWLINERANVDFYNIWEHPELQYRLLASCGVGRTQRHKWIANAPKGRKADKVTDFIGRFWPDANDAELSIIMKQFTDETFEDFVLSSGCTPDEAKEVMEAYGRLSGKAKPKAKKGGGKKRG